MTAIPSNATSNATLNTTLNTTPNTTPNDIDNISNNINAANQCDIDSTTNPPENGEIELSEFGKFGELSNSSTNEELLPIILELSRKMFKAKLAADTSNIFILKDGFGIWNMITSFIGQNLRERLLDIHYSKYGLFLRYNKISQDMLEEKGNINLFDIISINKEIKDDTYTLKIQTFTREYSFIFINEDEFNLIYEFLESFFKLSKIYPRYQNISDTNKSQSAIFIFIKLITMINYQILREIVNMQKEETNVRIFENINK